MLRPYNWCACWTPMRDHFKRKLFKQYELIFRTIIVSPHDRYQLPWKVRMAQENFLHETTKLTKKLRSHSLFSVYFSAISLLSTYTYNVAVQPISWAIDSGIWDTSLAIVKDVYNIIYSHVRIMCLYIVHIDFACISLRRFNGETFVMLLLLPIQMVATTTEQENLHAPEIKTKKK